VHDGRPVIVITSALLALGSAATADGGDPFPDAGAFRLGAPNPNDDGGTLEYFPDGGASPGVPAWLHLSGNKILPDEIYRNLLGLNEDSEPGPDSAPWIETRIYDYLVENGYELASVRASMNPDGGVDVNIDEGRLEKIVFRGRLTAQTLAFRLALFVDQEVFNRPALERQIAALEKQVGVKVVKWSLVPTANPEHVGPQLDSVMPAVEGFELLHTRDRYELHLFFEEHEWGTGVGLDLRSGYIDGLEVGVNLQAADIFLKGERLRIAASIGAGIRTHVLSGSYFPTFSRTFGEVQWYAPKFSVVRPYVWLTYQLVERARGDLGMESYHEQSALGSGHLQVQFTPRIQATFGLGLQWRRIFDLNYVFVPPNCTWPTQCVAVQAAGSPSGGGGPYPDPLPPVLQRLRAFVDVHGELALDNETTRPDRAHVAELGARWYLGRALDVGNTPDQGGYLQYGWAYYRYRVVIPFGWHDLWIKSRLRFLWGDIQFHDEEGLGELLRGLFGGTYVRKGGNASAEFRFSLSRDILKLSIFAEGAAWGEVNRNPPHAGDETPRVGLATGPGFHALIQGMFQLDIYAIFGIKSPLLSRADFGYGAVLFLNKVF
jgi:hypothetical protein